MRERIWSAVSAASTTNGSTGVCRKRDFFDMRGQLNHKNRSKLWGRVKLSTTEDTEDRPGNVSYSVSSVSSVVESLGGGELEIRTRGPAGSTPSRGPRPYGCRRVPTPRRP